MSNNSFTAQREDVVKDYNEFFSEWEPYIRNIVHGNRSFAPCDIDDIVQELLISLYTKDCLSIYDAEKGARFSTFLQSFVRRSLKGKRDRRMRIEWREGLSINDLDETALPDNLVRVFEDTPPSVTPEFLDMVASIYRQLRKESVTHYTNDFARLFSFVVQQIVFGVSPECTRVLGEVEAQKSGRYGLNRKALAYELGVSESSVSVMLTRLSELPLIKELLPS